jgi:potassium-dependent mechanosensitive channel
MKAAFCRAFAALLVALLMGLSNGAVSMAQTTDANDAAISDAAISDAATSTLDYDAWAAMALRAEVAVEDRAVPGGTLEQVRAQLVDWRGAFLVAQSANSARISSLRSQIAALGPAPADGAVEATEIAGRRTELSDQLVRLQAPGIAADEAYSRADGLIGEIDLRLRQRQADELLRLWPTPINPANWPAAMRAVSSVAVGLWSETAGKWHTAAARKQLGDNLPLTLVFLVLAIGLLWRGRAWFEQLALRLQTKAAAQRHKISSAPARGRRIWSLIASLVQIVVPTVGVMVLAKALQLTGMLGPLGDSIVKNLTQMGFVAFAAIWLGGQAFAVEANADAALRLTDDRRAKGRFATGAFGLVMAVEIFRRAVLEPVGANEAALAVLQFPILVLGGLLLLRLGHVLRRHKSAEKGDDDQPMFRNRILQLLAQGAVIIGVLGPALAAVGYVAAGAALIFPAGLTLGLVAVLFILQQLVDDIFAVVVRDRDPGRAALLPVLVSFALTLASLPVFALIWGARFEDLTELWTRFREGFLLGNTRISPTDFLFFAIIFALGYMLTRLLQGALKSTVLPKTSLDQGGQNAIVAGVGYTGIFIAALVAINAAGIDLSGLAIVAGALSVGIGFGLQNIVSNFVSGIILLIERPVSEGDWIEVGNVQGIVKAISVRSTRIQTFDRTDVIVPNTDLVAGRVTNWTRFNLTGRLIVPVGVVFDSDTRKVERILRDIAEAQPMAILNPPPVVAFVGFGADAMMFEIRVILRDVNFSPTVRSEINHQIVERLTAAGIGIAHNSREVTYKLEAERDAARAAQVSKGQPE